MAERNDSLTNVDGFLTAVAVAAVAMDDPRLGPPCTAKFFMAFDVVEKGLRERGEVGPAFEMLSAGLRSRVEVVGTDGLGEWYQPLFDWVIDAGFGESGS